MTYLYVTTNQSDALESKLKVGGAKPPKLSMRKKQKVKEKN
jgi:hypothetical protein